MTPALQRIPPEWVVSQQQYRAWLAEREREAELVKHIQRTVKELLRAAEA